MDELSKVLHLAADVTAAYRDSLAERPVRASADVDELAAALGGPLPSGPTAPTAVIEQLVRVGEAGVVASAGPWASDPSSPGPPARVRASEADCQRLSGDFSCGKSASASLRKTAPPVTIRSPGMRLPPLTLPART